jgi:protocatechuate 3,4-dioxygenase beta subunit
MRPAHIHLKVHRRGYEELTSQMYFSDDPYNKNDRILQGLAQEEREKVIVNFDGGSGQFNIAIKSF